MNHLAQLTIRFAKQISASRWYGLFFHLANPETLLFFGQGSVSVTFFSRSHMKTGGYLSRVLWLELVGSADEYRQTVLSFHFL